MGREGGGGRRDGGERGGKREREREEKGGDVYLSGTTVHRINVIATELTK